MQRLKQIARLLALIAAPHVSNGLAASPSPASPLSLQDISAGFASEDYAARHRALENFESYLLHQTSVLAANADEESLSQLTTAMHFQQRLTTWLMKQISFAPADTKGLLRFMTDREFLPLATQLFSNDPDTRIQGLAQLDQLTTPSAHALLLYFINDEDLRVSLQTIELVSNHKPTDTEVDTLWLLGMDKSLTLALSDAPVSLAPPLTFRGHPIGPRYPYQTSASPDATRAEAAREVLTHWAGPLIEKRVHAGLDRILAEVSPPESQLHTSIPRLKRILAALCTMVVDDQFTSCETTLVKMLNIPLNQKLQLSIGGQTTAYYSLHTDPLATLALLHHQKLEAYALKPIPYTQGWTSTNAADEARNVKAFLNP